MFVVTNSDLLYSFTTTKIYDRLAESAARIAFHNFEWSYTTLLIFNSTVVSGVNVFLKLYKNTQLVGKGKFYPPYAQITKQYILFGTDFLNIEQMLLWMSTHQFDNTGKYIVTCQFRECDENTAVDVFWKYKITNVVFLKLTALGEVVGYNYFYPDENCQNSKPVKIGICASDDASCSKMFPRKFKNLCRCPIIVSTFSQVPYMTIINGKPTGADGDLLKLIAEGLNASLILRTPHIGDGWGKRESNGTWTGSLADLLHDMANFSITSPALTISRISYFQMSISYGTVNVAWITHPAAVKPASLKLFYPFETLSQILLVVSFMFVGLCAWFVNSQYWPFSKKMHNNKENDSVLFYSWMICMGLPATKLPSKQAFLSMAFCWIWYCFFIRTLYQVCLISSLQGNFYYTQLDTIEEAFNENYDFGGGLALKDYFINEPVVYDNWKTVNTSDIVPTLMNLSKFTPNFVLAMNLETARSVIKKNKLSVHILPVKVINSPTAIFFKKFSPLVDSVNVILLRLIESGFSEKIHKNYATKTEPQDVDSRSPITLEHYTGCYVILIIGWIVSTALFATEICFYKLKRFKANR